MRRGRISTSITARRGFRSSLVNGHLSAANSDVRAGNVDRHNGRWTGLVNWWDGFIGSMFTADVEVPDDAPRTFPVTPRAGSKTIDVAVDDFLRSWLVEGQPNLAVAYVDAAAYDCLAQRLEKEGQALDRGLASLQLFARMKRINDLIGPRKSLAGTTRPRRLPDPALRVVDHKQQDQYAIYGVPRAMAERMSCASYNSFGDVAPDAGQPRTAARFRELLLDGRDRQAGSCGSGARPALAASRWDLEDRVLPGRCGRIRRHAGTMPELMKPAAPVAEPRLTADPSLLQANERFLDAWLVRKNLRRGRPRFRARGVCVRQSLPGPGGVAEDERCRTVGAVEGRSGAHERTGWRRGAVGGHHQPVEPTDTTLAHRRISRGPRRSRWLGCQTGWVPR